MAYFELPFGIRVSNNNPVDGDRYVAATATGRTSLISNGRAYNGLQVFQEDNKTLYILEDINTNLWRVVYTVPTGNTTSDIMNEIPTGAINGSNTGFTTSLPYVSGSISVFVNGLKERYFIEISDTQIGLSEAPKSIGFPDVVEVTYIKK